MTGDQLHQLLLEKWGCSYDVQLRKVKGRIFVNISFERPEIDTILYVGEE